MLIDCKGNEIIKYCGAHSASKSNDPKKGIFSFEIAEVKTKGKLYYSFYIRRDHFFDVAEKGTLIASCKVSDFETREEAFEYLFDYVLDNVYLDIWEKNFLRDEKRIIC